MTAKRFPVVIVPGIMGSELSVAGKTIWAANHRALSSILNPALLLPWCPAEPGDPIEAYRNVQTMLENKGYKLGQDLFAFGYDWRGSLQDAAASLKAYVDQVVRAAHAGRIFFITHSLGCLVLRWAITQGLIVSQKVECVLAAGPPMLGSALAFKSLLQMPEINDRFDRWFRVARRWSPQLGDRLSLSVTSALQSVSSLLELLPHEQIPVFMVNASQLEEAWQWPELADELRTLRDSAIRTQSALRNAAWPPAIKRQLVLSERFPIDTGYVVDPRDSRRIVCSWPTESGDGTVVADSARAFESDYPELVVNSRHDSLLSDPATLSWLDRRL